MPQPAWLVSGPPGCGKSTFVREEAKRRTLKLLHWNARVDRSLRDGRDRLHIQVRSKEPSLLWIEGIEDLTQEAQAFLRRILETATPQVLCILESTEPWRISMPVLSRCVFKEFSHFKKECAPVPLNKAFTLKDILTSWNTAEDPTILLKQILEGTDNATALEGYRKWGAGGSPWLILAWILAKREACV